CKSVVQFNKYVRLTDKMEQNTAWPLPMTIFKLDYAHKEYREKFGFEPRAYGIQTMRYDVDENGNIKGLYTQVLKETDDGMVIVEGTERHWPADLVLLSIGFEGTE